ncbi:MAG: aldehyde ferredoxin oxidoreductase C-terminal domain-containing protein [Candidatus Bipolaricaulota bacterium]
MNKRILRVDMNSLTAKFEDVAPEYVSLGGRGLTSAIVAAEVPPDCHPLGPNNKVVFAPGIVTGTSAPSSGRLSVGGKSPLTGGIKESNVGTRFAQTLARLGIQAVIVEGQSTSGCKLLKIDTTGVEFVDAAKWAGKGLYQAYEELHNEFGGNVDICGVGVVSEMSASNSGIVFNDLEGRSTRYAGRGGLGAVTATRGVKFMLLDGRDAPQVELKDKEAFDRGRRKLVEGLKAHDVTKPGGALASYGTDVLINILNEAGGLPPRNFSSGKEDLADLVSGERKAEIIKERGGTRPHSCHPGCIIQCSEVWTKEGGKEPVGVLEHESVWALGPNCGIYDLDVIGELNRACNDLGLDTIEMGNTLAVAMEGGMLGFGDGQGALQLMEEIRRGTPKGRMLMHGARFIGTALGVTRVPVVKGQAMPAYDPRAVKGMGITYATTPMGADHTAGYTVAPEIMVVGGKADPLATNKGEMSQNLQRATAVIDSAGYCLFTAFAVLDIPEALEGMVETVNGVLGASLTVDDIDRLGKDILDVEREFNKKAGFTKADDRLPEFMRMEKLPPHNHVFDVLEEQLDTVFDNE